MVVPVTYSRMTFRRFLTGMDDRTRNARGALVVTVTLAILLVPFTWAVLDSLADVGEPGAPMPASSPASDAGMTNAGDACDASAAGDGSK